MAQNVIVRDKSMGNRRFQERSWGWDTRFPSQWYPDCYFFRTDQNSLYQNTGTFTVPVWTSRKAAGAGDHDHSGSSQGGALHSTNTLVDLNGSNVSLLTLAVL